jgi:hypothetical protein
MRSSGAFEFIVTKEPGIAMGSIVKGTVNDAT